VRQRRRRNNTKKKIAARGASSRDTSAARSVLSKVKSQKQPHSRGRETRVALTRIINY